MRTADTPQASLDTSMRHRRKALPGASCGHEPPTGRASVAPDGHPRGAASALHKLYQQVFKLPAQGLQDRPRALMWPACTIGFIGLITAVGHGFSDRLPALWWITNIMAIIAFWWLTLWLLPARRRPWRTLMPCAVATGATEEPSARTPHHLAGHAPPNRCTLARQRKSV